MMIVGIIVLSFLGEPCVLPLFLHNGQCVETCPQTEPFFFGNATLVPPQCQPCKSTAFVLDCD